MRQFLLLKFIFSGEWARPSPQTPPPLCPLNSPPLANTSGSATGLAELHYVNWTAGQGRNFGLRSGSIPTAKKYEVHWVPRQEGVECNPLSTVGERRELSRWGPGRSSG